MADTSEVSASGSKSGSALGTALTGLLLLAPLATAVAPRLTWLFLLLLAGALVIGYWRQGGDLRQLINANYALIAALAVALYALLSATWSPNPGGTLAKAALLLGVVLLTFMAGNALTAWDQAQFRRASLAFALGAFLGGVYILAGILTQNAIQRAAEHAATMDGSGPNGHFVSRKPEELRRNVTMLLLHLWPALLALTFLLRPSRRWIFTLLFIAVVAVTVFMSRRESAQLALIGSVLAFVLASAWSRGVSRALAAAWCLAFIVVMPLTFAAYQSGVHMDESLPKSARARVILWEYTAERVLENPWIGIGADATPTTRKSIVAEQPDGFVYPRSTGHHAHNLFLQVWYELGLVGVVLVALAGAAIATRVTLLPAEAQPFAAATFAVFGANVAFAWGMWQTWLICGAALASLYLLIAARAVSEARARSAGELQPARQPSRKAQTGSSNG